MMIKLDIDCTAEEARRFLGLRELQPMQEAVLNELQQQMIANIRAMDAKAMLESWLPATLKGFDQLQQMFASHLAGASGKK